MNHCDIYFFSFSIVRLAKLQQEVFLSSSVVIYSSNQLQCNQEVGAVTKLLKGQYATYLRQFSHPIPFNPLPTDNPVTDYSQISDYSHVEALLLPL